MIFMLHFLERIKFVHQKSIVFLCTFIEKVKKTVFKLKKKKKGYYSCVTKETKNG